jgi:hypothetical protein
LAILRYSNSDMSLPTFSPSVNLPAPLTAKLTPPKMKKAAELKREQIRDSIFPDSANDIYNRTIHNGYSTVPRTIGLMLTLIERLADKGKNPSRVYCELWFRTYDDKLIEVKDEAELAYSSGLTVRRWRERIEVLNRLRFIKTAAIGSRKFGYILLRNPHNVVQEIKRSGVIPAEWWAAYTKRCVEIGYPLPEV